MDNPLIAVIVFPLLFVLLHHYGLPMLDWSAKFLWKGARLRIQNARGKREADFERKVQYLLADTTGLESLHWRFSDAIFFIGGIGCFCLAAIFLVLSSVYDLHADVLKDYYHFLYYCLARVLNLFFIILFCYAYYLLNVCLSLTRAISEADKRRKEASNGEHSAP